MPYLLGGRNDLVLYHPPKTAGLWARFAAQAAGLPWERYKDQHRDDVPPWGHFGFCFVRHPVDWLRSFWCFHEGTGWDQYVDAPHFIFYACYRPGEEFREFVSRYLDKMPGAIGRAFDRYTCHCQYVGRTETADESLIEALTLAGASFDAEAIRRCSPRNASRPAIKRLAVYSRGQVPEVCRAESEMLATWGYTFRDR